MTLVPTLKRTNSIWLVEMWIDEPRMKRQWVPTVGIALCRKHARLELADWKRANVRRFRLVRYKRA